MATVTYILRRGQPLTEEQKARLEALKQMPDEDIIYDEDCPELTDEQLKQFKRVNPLRKKRKSCGLRYFQLENIERSDLNESARVRNVGSHLNGNCNRRSGVNGYSAFR